MERDPVSPKVRPRYAEAYPRLDVGDAQRAYAAGRPVCIQSRIGRGVVAVGQITAHLRSGAPWPLLQAVFWFLADYHQWMESAVECTFRLQAREPALRHLGAYVICDECQSARAVLVYADKRWACRQCHGLRMRSQVIDPGVRLQEKILELEAVVRRGRPKGMHNRTFAAQMAELKSLKAQRSGSGMVVAAEHDKVVSAKWVTIDDPEFRDLGIEPVLNH